MAEPGDIWSHKPWWCQPWSIVLTGLVAVGGSWWWLRLWWVTLPLAVGVLLWWWLFLVAVPAAYAVEMQGANAQEQRLEADEARDQNSIL